MRNMAWAVAIWFGLHGTEDSVEVLDSYLGQVLRILLLSFCDGEAAEQHDHDNGQQDAQDRAEIASLVCP